MFLLIQTGFQLASSLDWGTPIGHFSILLFIDSIGELDTAVESKI